VKVVFGTENLPAESQNGVVALGFFDGFHIGHQALIQKGRELAEKSKKKLLVYTFDRHPLEIVDPPRAPLLLSTLEEKISLAKSFPIDFFLVGEFNNAIRQMEHQTFLKEIVAGKLNASYVVAGYNYRYGNQHQGNANTLLVDAPKFGITPFIVDAMKIGNEVVSSSRIRALLLEGKVEEAEMLLGRRYSLHGLAIHGDGRGKTLGVPTANLLIPSCKLIPRIGIYAILGCVDGKKLGGVASIGKRPTFGGKETVVEAHLFDFNEDLYGKTLDIEFVSWIRDEEFFPSQEALIHKMREDIEKGRKILMRLTKHTL